jgi:hypothetical protein
LPVLLLLLLLLLLASLLGSALKDEDEDHRDISRSGLTPFLKEVVMVLASILIISIYY